MKRKLYTDDLATRIKTSRNKKFKPSNGTEGDMFISMWCDECVHDANDTLATCDILLLSMVWGTEDPEYPKEWTFDDDGQPICTNFNERLSQ